MFTPPHDDHRDPARRRRLLFGAGLAAGVLVLGLLLFISWPAPTPKEASGPAKRASGAAVEKPPQPEAAPAPSTDLAPSAARPTRRRPRAEQPEASPESAPEASPGYAVRIESDVEGASVFVDRQYLGTAPLETTAIAPGSHQLNASAEGYDGIARTIEIDESGTTTITLRFREVRLDASVGVVHKHAMGSCEGHLSATTSGLRYESANKNDAFTLPFAALEQFDVDYLKKNLRVKQRGGRTWNFTEPTGDADKLFVFHRDVTKARERLIALGKSQ